MRSKKTLLKASPSGSFRPTLIVVLVAVVAAATVVLQANLSAKQTSSSTAKPAPADQCVLKNDITYTCYKNELTTAVNRVGPEQATAIVKAQYEKVPYVKTQCHQLMHAIGRAALIKHGDLGQTYVHGDHFCASGYFHGASEEIIKEKGADYIVQKADSVCDTFAKSRPYALDHYNCVHGLGHGFMEAQDGELFRSLQACDSLTGSWQQSSCYSGVFMQNIMIAQSPDESINHTSRYLKTDDPMYPCDAVEAKYKSGCYIIQTSWALQQVGYDYTKVFWLCDALNETNLRVICYQSLGRDVSGAQLNDVNKVISTCNLGGTPEARSNCFIGAAKDFVYTFHSDKQAYVLCGKLPVDIKPTCDSTVKSYYATFN